MLTYERYAEYRDRKNYNDHNVACLTGVHKSTFSGWKAGKYVPKLDVMLKIAKLLNIPPNEIVSRSDISKAKLSGDG